MLLHRYDDQILQARIISNKSLRRQLRKQRRTASEKMCDICQHKMLPGKDVATLLNLTTGRLACSSRNVHGAFHVFHASCLIHWILLCEHEMFMKPPVLPKVRRRSKRTKSKVNQLETECKADNVVKRKQTRREKEEVPSSDQINSVFCPDCQGTGLHIEGDNLEQPNVPLSEGTAGASCVDGGAIISKSGFPGDLGGKVTTFESGFTGGFGGPGNSADILTVVGVFDGGRIEGVFEIGGVDGSGSGGGPSTGKPNIEGASKGRIVNMRFDDVVKDDNHAEIAYCALEMKIYHFLKSDTTCSTHISIILHDKLQHFSVSYAMLRVLTFNNEQQLSQQLTLTMFKYKIKVSDTHRAWMKDPEVLENCSTGFVFPAQIDDAEGKVAHSKLLQFYRADEESWCQCS
uniref:Uncharacterized protein n=1 Tax=Chenopodium quinoa TaxID=63459 RepID=A0A803N9A7_CHEQI